MGIVQASRVPQKIVKYLRKCVGSFDNLYNLFYVGNIFNVYLTNPLGSSQFFQQFFFKGMEMISVNELLTR